MSHLKLIQDAPQELIPLLRRAHELRQALQFLIEGDDPTFVHWVERRGRGGVFLQATPIDVADVLRQHLWEKVDAAVLTSATLAVAGGFEYVQSRLGLEDARTLVVPSHFDYQYAGAPVCAEPPAEPCAAPPRCRRRATEILQILTASRGRAFVLFTSYQQMRQVYDRVSFAIEYPILMQGTGPRTALLEEFRETPHCVLFATSSFWQGVDVPGDQLSCVIIDKLPFAVPNDPVVEARDPECARGGRESFLRLSDPAGGHRAEAGVRTFDPHGYRPRRAVAAG